MPGGLVFRSSIGKDIHDEILERLAPNAPDLVPRMARDVNHVAGTNHLPRFDRFAALDPPCSSNTWYTCSASSCLCVGVALPGLMTVTNTSHASAWERSITSSLQCCRKKYGV